MNALDILLEEGREPTKRQKQFIALAASGLTTRKIGEKCFVSEHTVRNSLVNAKDRTKSSSTSNMLAVAVCKNWIVPEKNTHPVTFKPN